MSFNKYQVLKYWKVWSILIAVPKLYFPAKTGILNCNSQVLPISRSLFLNRKKRKESVKVAGLLAVWLS